MKLLIHHHDIRTLNHQYITDENQNNLYLIEIKNLSLGIQFTLTHQSKSILVKQKPFSFTPTFMITDQGKTYEMKQKTSLMKEYHLSKLNWHIQGDLLKQNYFIEDQQKQTIASFSNHQQEWVIDINDQKNTMIIAAIAIIIVYVQMNNHL